MMRKLAVLAVVCLLFLGRTAWAHRIDEYLQATILFLREHRVNASMRLIPGVLVAPSVIATIDTNHDGVFSKDETNAYAQRVLQDLSITLDGKSLRAQLDAWTVPEASQLRDGLGEISIRYHVDLPASRDGSQRFLLANHHLNSGSVYLVNVEVPESPRPSYWTVYDVVRELPQSLRTLAHDGGKRYGESFDLVHRREAARANSIWQADHAQLDIKLLREDGTIARPWLTVVIDDYSRAVAGYYLGFDPPSSMRISLALRQGIWRKGHPHWQICGIPDVLYTDNGTDFTSKHLEQVAADLKVRLVFSIPGKPRGRGRIERFFRTVNEMFLCDLDGFIRNKRRSPSLSLNGFEEKFRHFLLEIYHRRSSVDGRLPPAERWEEGGFLPRMPESLEQLDLLLKHEVRARKIRRDGIHFQGLRYLSLTLAAYVGEDATIRFDPRDMGEIRVFYQDRFLCRAISGRVTRVLTRGPRTSA